MFTIALLGWTMMCIVDFERGRCGLGRLAGLIPLYIVWTNLHGGVLGGTMTLGLAVAGWGVLFLLKQPSPIQSWRTAWLLAGIVIACLLTPFVNPFGMEMINTWQRIVGSPVLKKVVNEHMPLNPSTQLGLLLGDRLVMVNDEGVLTSLDAKTGKPLGSERLNGAFSASPIFASGYIYLPNQTGKTSVVKLTKEGFEPVATNELKDGCMASPAVSGDAILLRTKTHLYSIGSK